MYLAALGEAPAPAPLISVNIPTGPGGTPYLGPGGAGYRLDLLRDAWNQLRADVLGRGLVPDARVPRALADKVGARYEAWRGWYQDAARSFQDAAAVHYGSEFSRHLDAWTKEYDQLRNEAAAVLVPQGMPLKAPALSPVPKSKLPLAAGDWGPVVAVVGTGLFLLGLVWVLRTTR